MAILSREDGVSFATRNYREILAPKSTSLLRRELQFLTSQHGQYVRIFPQADGSFEAVFAKEQGYLLGEIVWDQLNQPDNLIYCEQLPFSGQIVMVVVRDGSIFLEAAVAPENFMDELAALLTSDYPYQIYVYGDVPLAEFASEDVFSFPPELVTSFTQLDESLFARLPTDRDFKLLPAAQAANMAFPKPAIPPWLVGAAVIGGIVFLVMFLWPEPPPPPPPPTPVVVQDPYQAYANALMTPAPDVMLRSLAADLSFLTTLPGWVATNVVFDGNVIGVRVRSLGGTTRSLLQWGQAHNVDVTIDSSGVSLALPRRFDSRGRPGEIMSRTLVFSTLIDRYKRVLPANNIQFKETKERGRFSETELDLSFDKVSLDILALIANEMTGLPVVFKSANLKVENHVYTGQISIAVLGG